VLARILRKETIRHTRKKRPTVIRSVEERLGSVYAAFAILLALKARGFLRSRGFGPVSSVGSSHSALTSGEDNAEALLLGYPPIGLLDDKDFRMTDLEKASLISPAWNAEALRPRLVRPPS
jgi:hypothetical protein